MITKSDRPNLEKFSRYEFKYILDPNQRIMIENEILNFMNYDGFAREDFKHKYFVKSIYFDDTYYSHYYDKIDHRFTAFQKIKNFL